MKKKNVKFDLEANRKIYFSLGLFIVSATILMAFSYKTPVYFIEKERVVQKIDIPIVLVEEELPEVVVIPEPISVSKNTEPTTPLLSTDLLNNVEATKSTDNDVKLFVSTPEPVDVSTLNFSPTLSAAPDLTVVVEFPDNVAEFKGSWKNFLIDNLDYPYASIRAREQGTVYLNFIVEVDGSITDIEVLSKDAPKSLQNEAIRVLNKSPKWKPGMQKGEYVRSKRTVKIDFILEG